MTKVDSFNMINNYFAGIANITNSITRRNKQGKSSDKTIDPFQPKKIARRRTNTNMERKLSILYGHYFIASTLLIRIAYPT